MTDQRAGKGHPLLLTAGELVRISGRQRLDPNEAQDVVDFLRPLGAWGLHGHQHELQVLPDRQVRPESQILKHEPDPTLMRRDDAATGAGHVRAAQVDVAAVRHVETRNQAQQGRLTAAAGPEDDDRIAGTDFERHTVERVMRPEAFPDIRDDECRSAHRTSRSDATAPSTASGVKMTPACNRASAATWDEGVFAMMV